MFKVGDWVVTVVDEASNVKHGAGALGVVSMVQGNILKIVWDRSTLGPAAGRTFGRNWWAHYDEVQKVDK